MHRSTDHTHEDEAHSHKPKHERKRKHKHGHRHKHSHHHHAHDHEESEDEEQGDSLYEYYGELEREVGFKLLSDLVKTLKKNATANLSDHQLSITDDAYFSIKHAETWDETEKLTLEIEWYPAHDESGEEDDEEDEEQALPTIN